MCLGLNHLEDPQVYVHSVDFLYILSRSSSYVSLSPSGLLKFLNVIKLMFFLFWFNLFSIVHKFSKIAEFMRVICLFFCLKVRLTHNDLKSFKMSLSP